MDDQLGLRQRDREVLLDELERLGRLPAPMDYRPIGCGMLLVSLVGLLVVPSLSFLPKPPPGWGSVVFWVLVGVGVVGAFVFLSLGSPGYAAQSVRLEEALVALAGEPGREEALRSAVRVLTSTYYARGPGGTTVIPIEDLRMKLGRAGELVAEVERFLVDEGRIDPVLTLPDREGSGPDADTPPG